LLQYIGTIEKVVKDRHKWRTFVAAIHGNNREDGQRQT